MGYAKARTDSNKEVPYPHILPLRAMCHNVLMMFPVTMYCEAGGIVLVDQTHSMLIHTTYHTASLV